MSATAFNCPQCGASVPGAVSMGPVDCGACGEPLAVYDPDIIPRSFVDPRLNADHAVERALAAWKDELVPGNFATPEQVGRPQLLFVAFWEVERTTGGELRDERHFVPATKMPGLPLEKLDVRAAREARQPFDALAMQRRGIVLDPLIDASAAVPPPSSTLAENRRVVFIPLWLVRCRYGRDLYELYLDAITGVPVTGRAPTRRDSRLPQSIAAIYLLALITGMPLRGWGTLAGWLSNLDTLGLAIMLAIPGLLVWIVAWSWDRLRFRYELAIDGTQRTFVAINRPEKTAPEKVRDGLFKTAAWIMDKVG